MTAGYVSPAPSLRTLRRCDRLALGNTSDVFSWTPTSVVKVLRAGIPERWAEIEAEITAMVHAAGLPVPAVEGTLRIGGRPAIVFERVDGALMWDHMKTSRYEAHRLTSVFIGLQRDIHSVVAPPGLPSGRQRLREKVRMAKGMAKADRMVALTALEALADGDALCHGDLHPGNVVMSSRGPVVVDWFDASSGPAVADVVRSSLLMRPGRDLHPRCHLTGGSQRLLERIHRDYLVGALTGVDIGTKVLAAWEAVSAVARLAEPVPSGDLAMIWSRWRDGAKGGSAILEDVLGSR